MGEFLQFFDRIVKQQQSLHLDIYYSKTLDYLVRIWQQGGAEDGSDLMICDFQHPDLDYAMTKAKYELMEWLFEVQGGF